MLIKRYWFDRDAQQNLKYYREVNMEKLQIIESVNQLFISADIRDWETDILILI